MTPIPHTLSVLVQLAEDVAAELARPRIETFVAVAIDERTGAAVRFVAAAEVSP